MPCSYQKIKTQLIIIIIIYIYNIYIADPMNNSYCFVHKHHLVFSLIVTYYTN